MSNPSIITEAAQRLDKNDYEQTGRPAMLPAGKYSDLWILATDRITQLHTKQSQEEPITTEWLWELKPTHVIINQLFRYTLIGGIQLDITNINDNWRIELTNKDASAIIRLPDWHRTTRTQILTLLQAFQQPNNTPHNNYG